MVTTLGRKKEGRKDIPDCNDEGFGGGVVLDSDDERTRARQVVESMLSVPLVVEGEMGNREVFGERDW